MGNLIRIISLVCMSLFLYVIVGMLFLKGSDYGKSFIGIGKTLVLVIYNKYLFLENIRGLKGSRTAVVRAWLMLPLCHFYFILGGVLGMSYYFHSENEFVFGLSFLYLQFIFLVLALLVTICYFYEKGLIMIEHKEKARSI